MRFLLLSLLLFPFIGLAQDTPSSLPAQRSIVLSGPSDGSSFVPAPALPASEDRTADFIVNYTGFSTEAQTAFQYAVDIWSALITSDVPIVIDATWEDLPGNTLGSAGATNLWYNFGGAPFNGVLYPSPLADKLAGSDLDPGSADMVANFDSGTDWYFGLDGNTPFAQYDLVSVVLHEIGHGLGFSGTMYVGVDLNGYVLNGSLAHIYDQFVYTGAGEALLDIGNGTSGLADALLSDNLYWAGIQANAYSGDFSPKLYAPAFWEQGSSLSHFDEATYPAGNEHSLMTPAIGNGEAIHSPGPMALGLLEDIGWTVDYDALDGGGGVPGCTDIEACNYDPAATLPDGSCLYPVADEPCGTCNATWTLSANLASGEGQAFTFGGVGPVGPVDITVQWPGESGNGEWVSDLLVVLCDPDENCVEWGGYDFSAGETPAGVDWPVEWDTPDGGTYTASLDLTASGLSGLGTWTVSVYNGYLSSNGLDLTSVSLSLPYVCPLLDLEPGCTDPAACNFDPAAEFNDGSCDYFCFTCTETLLQESFQSYDAFTPLTVQSTAGWQTWSGPSGTAEDPFVVFDGFDGAVALVSAEADPAQANDLYFPIGATDGEHVVQFTLRTDPGQTAYYNFQGDPTPGITWAMEVFIGPDGAMTFVQDTDTVGTATGYLTGQDNLLTHLIDLDADEIRILRGSNLIALLDYPGDLGGINFYAFSFDGGIGQYLLDDVTVCASSTEVAGCTDPMACNYSADAVVDDGSCWTPFDYGWCDCDGNVFDALGECGGDCPADVDDDGVCDDEDDCIGGEPDECGVCDGPGAVYECGCADIPEGDCDCDGNQLDALGICGGDCDADLDQDGVCDVPGCTDPEACNYDAGANYEDGSCEYAAPFYDCAGNCLNDADGDGVCDELEITGCTDPAACNYNEASTEEDGSCAYLVSESISGNAEVTEGDTQLYTVAPSDPGNTYTWAVSGGTLVSGQGTAIVTIEWTAVGSHALQVIETNPSCNGDLLQLEVTVSPVISVVEESLAAWTVYPNPAVDGLRLDGLRANTPIAVRLLQSDGRLVREWPACRNGAWLALDGVAPGWYVLEGRMQGHRAVRPLLKE